MWGVVLWMVLAGAQSIAQNQPRDPGWYIFSLKNMSQYQQITKHPTAIGNQTSHTPHPLTAEDTYFFALYFPQFYPSADNNNDSDWKYFRTDALRANAYGHPISRPQNHIYYDPRHIHTRASQAYLARKYGIDGFIYYHYYMDGVVRLPDVFEALVADGEPSLPFALCWVNDPWGNDTALKYTHPRKHAQVLFPLLVHRWAAVYEGRRLFYIYHAQLVPPLYLNALRRYLREMGVDIHIIQFIQTFRNPALTFIDHVDGYAEFPSNLPSSCLDRFCKRPKPIQVGFSVNFDNTPRATWNEHNPAVPLPATAILSKGRAHSRMRRDGRMLRKACVHKISQWRRALPAAAPKVVIVFAWNEWSEQACLEPSDHFGYETITAIAQCKSEVAGK